MPILIAYFNSFTNLFSTISATPNMSWVIGMIIGGIIGDVSTLLLIISYKLKNDKEIKELYNRIKILKTMGHKNQEACDNETHRT